MRAPAAACIFFLFIFFYRTIASLLEPCLDAVSNVVEAKGRGRRTVVSGGPLHDLPSMSKT